MLKGATMLSNFLKRLLMARQADFGDYEIRIFDSRYSIFSVREMIALQDALKKNLKNKHSEIFYKIGKDSSKYMIKSLQKKFGIKGGELFKLCINILQTCGLGEISVISLNLNGGKGIIHAKSIFAEEYMILNGMQKQPIDHHFAGILAGTLEEITGKKVACTETVCVSCGRQYCEFVLKPQ